MRYVRITCCPVDDMDYENIHIDAILDAADKIHGNYSLFGLWGDPYKESANFCPLMFKGDGTIVYDALHATEDQLFHFNLRDGKIELKRLLKYVQKSDPYEKVAYRISDIQELAAT